MTSPYGLSTSQRLRLHGPEGLSDAELVAVVLRVGVPGRPARLLAQELLAEAGGLTGLLAQRAHVSTARYAGDLQEPALAVVLEMAKRVTAQQLESREVFASPDAVKRFLQLQIAACEHEVFAVLFLDAQNRMIKFAEMFQGTLTQTSVYPREILARALELKAASVILAHNHPSGTVQPSRSDEALTHTLKAALALIDVRVLDHVIVAQGDALSMAERGLV